MKVLESISDSNNMILELEQSDSCLVFSESGENTEVQIFIPKLETEENIPETHAYCAAVAALSSDKEFVDYAINKFINSTRN